ncbi:MAG: winged helix-turn-helix transcriptional regulator [Candidatus Bathyarchaeia archaeon]
MDRKILQALSVGTSSYEELARLCNSSRNTVYRRIASLEKRGIIRNTISGTVNFEQLAISPVIIGFSVSQACQDRASNLLATSPNVKFLWRTYGEHDINLVAFCPKGEEGRTIQSIKALLQEFDATDIHLSVGFTWEKADYTPFIDELETVRAEIVQMANCKLKQ